jgi:hypothetical protein
LIHPAHGDVIALENQNGILWLLERTENALFQADSSLAFDGEAEQWDGLDALIDATSFVDLEGQPMQEADVEEASNLIIENFGYPTDMFLGTRPMSDLVKTMYPRERVNLPAPTNGVIGQAVTSMATQAGTIEFNPSVFLRRLPVPPTSPTSANAPAIPAMVAAVATVPGAGGTGDFNKAAPAGDLNYYSYVVTACNRFGESGMSPLMANGVQMTQAFKDAFRYMALAWNNAAVIGAFPPEYFRIYRSTPQTTNAQVTGAANYSLIMQVPAITQVAGAAGNIASDVNFLLPFTYLAYLGELTPNVITFRQLAPMMRLDLAVLAPAYRWMILLYGTPILFAPKKWLRMINIGQVV